MSVNAGCGEEYALRHQPVWDELAAVLKDHGVRNYSIHLDPESNRLFAYAEIESEERWNAIAETGICRRWWAHMADLMPTNPDKSPVATPLTEVFHLA